MLLLAGLLACAPPGLAPTRDLVGDTMLAAFPADTTLIAGADVAEARALPAWAELPGVEALVGADRLRVGCFDEGCVALAEGGALVFPEGTPRARGVDLPTELGLLVVRRLAPQKAVAGDLRAVARVAAERALGDPGLDVTRFAGLVPEGEAWAAAYGRDALDALGDRVGIALPEVEGVTAVAAAYDVDTGLVRVRVRGADPATLAAIARAQLERRKMDGDVVTVGDLVEVTVSR